MGQLREAQDKRDILYAYSNAYREVNGTEPPADVSEKSVEEIHDLINVLAIEYARR